MKKLFIAIPCYSQQVHIFTMMSLIQALSAVAQAGWTWHMHCQVGDGLIARCRNMLITEFFQTDCTDMFWLDDDVQFSPEDMLRVIDGREPFLAGVYRVKSPNIRFPANFHAELKRQENGYAEAEHVPFGFVRTTRGMIERMIKELNPPTWGESGKRHYELFGHEIHSDLYWGEDYTFCNRWRRIGGKVWVEPDVHLTHHGITGFQGKVADLIESEQRVNDLFKKALAA